ncbi:MAG: short-chain alcohol dehydrogenase [Sporothrix thermara]
MPDQAGRVHLVTGANTGLAQGYELTLGVNCVGHGLALLSYFPPNGVRVIWLSSYGLDKSGGKVPVASDRYSVSKTGVWALGVEYARRHRQDNIASVPINPGNLMSELSRDMDFIFRMLTSPLCCPVVNGASTSGGWIIPFGRVYPLKSSLVSATKLESEGGTGGCAEFWQWTEDQVKEYL